MSLGLFFFFFFLSSNIAIYYEGEDDLVWGFVVNVVCNDPSGEEMVPAFPVFVAPRMVSLGMSLVLTCPTGEWKALGCVQAGADTKMKGAKHAAWV